jgi:pantoate--beta-alanine ligase
METLRTVDLMKKWSRSIRDQGLTIGLVPTMGYLHEGHLSLMRRAGEENLRLVASIFVNPTQFGPTEDLDSYPRDPESDSRKCEEVGVDALFMPEPDDVYGPGFQTSVSLTQVASPLCGASRPGHFQGVATVVLKLFNIVMPDAAYFGAKDYQQLQVIRTMARDLNLDVQVVSCDIVREEDGLAMSSRNKYLSDSERKQAVALYQALQAAKKLFRAGEGEAGAYVAAMSERIKREPDAEVDYVSLVHPETLVDLERVEGRALAALAVRIGATRLIDNLLME